MSSPRENSDVLKEFESPDCKIIVQYHGKILILNYQTGRVLIGNHWSEYDFFQRCVKYFPDGFSNPHIVHFNLIQTSERYYFPEAQKKIVLENMKDNCNKDIINAALNDGMTNIFIEDLVQLPLEKLMAEIEFKNSVYNPMFMYDLKYQALQGLEFLHNHQITHFDIKPSNYQIYPDGRLVYIDFNISHFTGDVIRKGTGTKYFISP